MVGGKSGKRGAKVCVGGGETFLRRGEATVPCDPCRFQRFQFCHHKGHEGTRRKTTQGPSTALASVGMTKGSEATYERDLDGAGDLGSRDRDSECGGILHDYIAWVGD